jgi:amino acid transporter
MKLNRNYITPFITLVFLVVAISGLLMFFHLFDGYTEVVHEFLGIGFVTVAVFHIIVNWKPLSSHFKKKVFLPTAIAVLLISLTFIVAEKINQPVDMILIKKIVKAPLPDAFKALGINYTKAAKALENKGIPIGNAKTMEEIWISNKVSPEDVIVAITE